MKSLLLPVLLFASSLLFAANNSAADMVYLKNGTVIKGRIIEQVPNASVTIETSTGQVFFYPLQEVEKLAKEEIASRALPAAPALPASPPYRGGGGGFSFESTPEGHYMGFFEIGGLFGIGSKITDPSSFTSTERIKVPYSQNFFSMVTVQGRILPGRKVFIGFGFGFDMSTTAYLNQLANPYNALTAYAKNDFLVPVFMDIRGYILKKRISPFIEGKLGYAFCLPAPPTALNNGYQFDGGPTLSLNVGVRAFITHRIAANLGFGYRVQNLITQQQYPTYDKYGTPTGDYTAKTDIFFLHYLNLMAGISF